MNPFSLKGKKILVLTHKGADVDAISASSILYLLLRKDNLVEIAVPEHLNKTAEKLAEQMEIPFTMQPDFSMFDTLFIVDLNSYSMLGNLAPEAKNFKGKRFLFDHHTKSDESIEADYCECIENAASTTEVLWNEMKKHSIKPNEKIALLTATGLITDSGGFSFVSRDSFRVMAEVLELTKKDYREIRELFSVEVDFSERLARLKAARKSRIYRVGDFIAVTSEIGSFESQSASALVRVAADIAFVAMKSKGKVRVSGRARFKFVDEFELDLARDIFQPLSEFFEGEGGGHVTAAAFTGKSDSKQAVLDKCMELLLEKIKEKNKRGLEFKEYK